MADWKKGDLALCVRKGTHNTAKVGCCYEVIEVPYFGPWLEDDAEAAGLLIDGATNPQNAERGGFIHEQYFRKVTPPKADQFDREIIDLMQPKRVEA